MILPIDDQLYLSPPAQTDIPAYVLYLNDPEIHARTLMIPSPYEEKDARFFLDFCAMQINKFGHPLNFAIRNSNGELLGGIGYHGKNIFPAIAHRDEIGYWIARPFWGKGIMTKALQAMVKYGVESRKLQRIDAPIYASNIGSERVLRKCGFTEEGPQRKAYFKNGQFHDGKMFAFVVE